jgi:PDZ domain-containing secreted protein
MRAERVKPTLTVDRALRRIPRLLVLLLLAPIVAAWVPGPTVRGPGPVIDLSKALAIEAVGHVRAGHQGRLLLTSVREEHDPTWLWATRWLVEPNWESTGGTAAGAMNTLAQMQQAKAYAWEVAVALALSPTDSESLLAGAERSPTGPMPSINTEGLTGPSGGLMLALAFTDALNPGDLTAGRDIAGTGTIDWDGSVGEIGYAAYKVRGAAAAGASVFFVPWGNLEEARQAAPPGLQVVPVGTFVDAVDWLCGHGAVDGACAKVNGRGLP